MIFVDTGVWFSLVLLKDSNHAKSSAWFRSLRDPLVTSDYIVDETLALLLMRGERAKAIEFFSNTNLTMGQNGNAYRQEQT